MSTNQTDIAQLVADSKVPAGALKPDVKTTSHDKSQSKSTTRLIIKLQRLFRDRHAQMELLKGPYWSETINTQKYTPQHQFLKLKSQENIQRLREELGVLAKSERQLIRFFLAQDFSMTHYTLHANKILSSGSICSTQMLEKMHGNRNFHTNSKDNSVTAPNADYERLGNADYIFFRFQMMQAKDKTSRFGSMQFTFDVRTCGLLDTGWVSMYEMLFPKNISIFNSLKYKGQELRSINDFKGYQGMRFRYPQLNGRVVERPFELTDDIFYGPDILLGISLAMLREIRLIGGCYQHEVLSLLAKLAQSRKKMGIDPNAAPYTALVTKLNELLVQLFRVEAKMPGRVTLYKGQFTLLENEYALINAIVRDELSQVKSLLNLSQINDELIPIEVKGISQKVTPLYWALYCGSILSVQWLLANKANSDVSKYSEGLQVNDLLNESLLRLASYNHLEKIARLKQQYPTLDLNYTDSEKQSAAIYAAKCGNLAVIQWLFTNGANPKLVDIHGKNYRVHLLEYTADQISFANWKIVGTLFKCFPSFASEIRIGDTPGMEHSRTVTEHAYTDIQQAIKRGDLQQLQNIVAASPLIRLDPESSGSKMKSSGCVILAATQQQYHILKWLLTQPTVNPNYVDYEERNYRRILEDDLEDVATFGRGCSLLADMIRYFPKIVFERGSFYIDRADKNGRTDILMLLLAKLPLSPDIRQDYSQQVQAYAAKSGNIDLIKQLKRKFPELNPSHSNVVTTCFGNGNYRLLSCLTAKGWLELEQAMEQIPKSEPVLGHAIL